jgi:hypothetical protein
MEQDHECFVEQCEAHAPLGVGGTGPGGRQPLMTFSAGSHETLPWD